MQIATNHATFAPLTAYEPVGGDLSPNAVGLATRFSEKALSPELTLSGTSPLLHNVLCLLQCASIHRNLDILPTQAHRPDSQTLFRVFQATTVVQPEMLFV
jgi:hypothetical protein